MTNTNFEDEDEKPLDPVMEKVRRKMVRLQIISASTIVVSLMAVLGAVVYKASRSEAENTGPGASISVPEGATLALNAKLPAGFRLQSASLDANRVLLTGTDGQGKTMLHVFDMAAGRVIATISLETP